MALVIATAAATALGITGIGDLAPIRASADLAISVQCDGSARETESKTATLTVYLFESVGPHNQHRYWHSACRLCARSAAASYVGLGWPRASSACYTAITITVIYLLDKTTVVQLYQGCVLISRPRYDRELQFWVPYASIAWPEQSPSQYHQLTPFDRTFETEAEALAFGFIAARAWIDENQNMQDPRTPGGLHGTKPHHIC